jgi:hypothetical protein
MKADTFFFTSLEPHSGHCVSLSEAPIFWSKEKFPLQFRHSYSYIGNSYLL